MTDPTHPWSRQIPAAPLPEPAPSKIIPKKSGIFLAPDLRPFSDHHSPAIHHDFTTKRPQSAATFSQKPLQKHRFTSPKKNEPAMRHFLAKTTAETQVRV
jgi:hypothetical protein